MPAHKRITDGRWVACHATSRACPRLYHAPVEIEDVQESMLDQLYFTRREPDMIDSVGTKFWTDEDGNYHSEYDQPAVIQRNGAEEWYSHGKLHRDRDLPAVVENGYYEWYRDDKRHREGDKPAIIHADGTQEYLMDDHLHRGGDKPAIIRADGEKQYWVDGMLHREGNPAIIGADGRESWWVEDRQVG